MTNPKTLMDVFKHLDKSNCRECGEKTCLAFAAAVFQARKPITRCPRISPEIAARLSDTVQKADSGLGDQVIQELRQRLSTVDLEEAAKRTGGNYLDHKLVVKVLGKDFGIDAKGNFKTDIHVNPWVAGPLIEYILQSKGVEPDGNWVSFRELQVSKKFSYPFFKKRCEEVMRRIADIYTDLFEDLVHIFGGQQVAEQFESDVSVVLYPLPKVPVMICYWKPEEGMDSVLNIFFDKSVNQNLPGEPLFTMSVGFAYMLERLAERHAAFVGAG